MKELAQRGCWHAEGGKASKYTSLDVSRRLMDAGFKADIDGQHVVGDGLDPLPPVDNSLAMNTERVPSYRTDTLMEWLLGRRVALFVDRRMDAYYVYPFHEGDDCFAFGSLPNALGEVVLEVLAREARE